MTIFGLAESIKKINWSKLDRNVKIKQRSDLMPWMNGRQLSRVLSYCNKINKNVQI